MDVLRQPALVTKLHFVTQLLLKLYFLLLVLVILYLEVVLQSVRNAIS